MHRNKRLLSEDPQEKDCFPISIWCVTNQLITIVLCDIRFCQNISVKQKIFYVLPNKFCLHLFSYHMALCDSPYFPYFQQKSIIGSPKDGICAFMRHICWGHRQSILTHKTDFKQNNKRTYRKNTDSVQNPLTLLSCEIISVKYISQCWDDSAVCCQLKCIFHYTGLH